MSQSPEATSDATRAFKSLFDGRPVSIETARTAHRIHELYPEERLAIAGAVPARQAEFATARLCARAALARLGVAPAPMLPGRDRSPRWPAGVVGSITHSHGLCAVAVASKNDFEGIGIDAERTDPLPSELEELVCTPTERSWLDKQTPADRGRWAKIIFSGKEAFYKCQYPKTKQWLDFLEVELRFDAASPAFSARVIKAGICHEPRSECGRWVWTQEFVLTAYSWFPDTRTDWTGTD